MLSGVFKKPMATVIREFCDADAASLTALYNQFILKTAITFDVEPYTLEQRKVCWLSHYSYSGKYRLFVAETAGDVIGYASSSQLRQKAAFETSVETSIYVLPTFQGHGVGSQLYAELFRALSQEDVHRAYAGITLPNDASLAIHTKFGFEQVGIFREVGRKFGQYWDVAWWERAM